MDKKIGFSRVIALLAILLLSPSTGASHFLQWEKLPGGDEVYSVQPTADGGYILAGKITSHEIVRGWVIKTDENGTVQWNRTLGGTFLFNWEDVPGNDTDKLLKFLKEDLNIDNVTNIVKKDDGGNISLSYKGEYFDIQNLSIIRNLSAELYLDENTDTMRITTSSRLVYYLDVEKKSGKHGIYGYSYVARSAHQTTDGGYVIAGDLYSYGTGKNYLWLIKTDENGIEQWNKTFENHYNNKAYFVKQTSDDGYIISCNAYQKLGDDGNIWLVKTDRNGNEVLNKTLGRTWGGVTQPIQQTSDNGYVLVEVAWNGSETCLIKTDEYFNQSWKRIFKNYTAYSVQEMASGGYILTGRYGNNASLIKADANGIEQWNKTFKGKPRESNILSGQQTVDDGYILAGYTGAFESDYSKYLFGDARLIRTDADGNELWNATLRENESSRLYSVLQTKDGGYVAAGWLNLYDNNNWIYYSGAWLIKIKDTEANISKSTPAVNSIELNQSNQTAAVKITQRSIPSFKLFEAVLSVALLFLLKRKRINKGED